MPEKTSEKDYLNVASVERLLCMQLSKIVDGLDFAEIPREGRIGIQEVSLELTSTVEYSVYVVFDCSRRSGEDKDKLAKDWQVVKRHVEDTHPDAPWVKHGLDNSIVYPRVNNQEILVSPKMSRFDDVSVDELCSFVEFDDVRKQLRDMLETAIAIVELKTHAPHHLELVHQNALLAQYQSAIVNICRELGSDPNFSVVDPEYYADIALEAIQNLKDENKLLQQECDRLTQDIEEYKAPLIEACKKYNVDVKEDVERPGYYFEKIEEALIHRNSEEEVLETHIDARAQKDEEQKRRTESIAEQSKSARQSEKEDDVFAIAATSAIAVPAGIVAMSTLAGAKELSGGVNASPAEAIAQARGIAAALNNSNITIKAPER